MISTSTGGVYTAEEVLVARVDRASTILQILYHNENLAKFGERISGKTVRSIGLEPTICKQCEEYLNKVFLNLRKEVFQLHIQNRDYMISYLPEWNGKSQVDTVLTIVRVMTKEQNLTEERLIRQGQLQMSPQITMIGYFDRDITNDKFFLSNQLYKKINLAPQVQRPSIELMLSLIHPVDVKVTPKMILHIKQEGFLDMEHCIIRKDGSIGWIHSLVQSIFDDNGNLSRQFGIVQDITKWKTIEFELKELTEQLQQANELLTAKQISTKMAGAIAKLGYFEWDQGNDCLYWSDQQYRNYGYTPGEVVPTRELFRSRVHPEDWILVEMGLDAFHERSYLEFEFRVVKADGTQGWLHSRIHLMPNEQGRPVKLFGITQDVTQQKEAEEQIHKVEKELAFTNQLYSRSSYLNRLLFNDFPVEQISKVLTEVGIETQVRHCCFAVQLAENSAYPIERINNETTPLIIRKQAVLIWLAEKEWGLVWRCHDDIVILLSLSDQLIANKQSQIKLANDIIAQIEHGFPHFHVNVGISGISNIPVNIREIYEKAHRAVVIAASSMVDSTAIHGDDIGLYEVAFQLLKDENTCTIVQNTIGRLAEHDEARGSNLLMTLECILEYGSLKTVAQKLFLHHNTVIWRKRRIETFLDMPLDKMETKMLLLLYIKIWNLKKNIL